MGAGVAWSGTIKKRLTELFSFLFFFSRVRGGGGGGEWEQGGSAA